MIAGLVVGIVFSGLIVAMSGRPPSSYGMLVGYTTMLTAFSAVFLGIKKYRDVNLGGAIRFWPAFGMGLAISLIASIFYVVAWEVAQAATHMDFAGSYSRTIIEQHKAKGISGKALAALIAEIAHPIREPVVSPANDVCRDFPVGALVSLVSAGLLRISRFLALRRS